MWSIITVLSNSIALVPIHPYFPFVTSSLNWLPILYSFIFCSPINTALSAYTHCSLPYFPRHFHFESFWLDSPSWQHYISTSDSTLKIWCQVCWFNPKGWQTSSSQSLKYSNLWQANHMHCKPHELNVIQLLIPCLTLWEYGAC